MVGWWGWVPVPLRELSHSLISLTQRMVYTRAPALSFSYRVEPSSPCANQITAHHSPQWVRGSVSLRSREAKRFPANCSKTCNLATHLVQFQPSENHGASLNLSQNLDNSTGRLAAPLYPTGFNAVHRRPAVFLTSPVQ